MTVGWETIRCMIWGKTYPELSSHHTETVCTGAVLENGDALRLYPVPLRYLEGEQQYRLYDIVEVDTMVNSKDQRPESRKIRADSLRIVGHVETDRDEWAQRRIWIDRGKGTWHFKSMDNLRTREEETGQSMGFIDVGAVAGISLVPKPASERARHDEKWLEVSSQVDAFLPEYKSLDFIPVYIRLRWHCADPCSVCSKTPHDMSVLDWGLIQLGRKEGWEAARAKLESLSALKEHDFKLFVGNFFRHPKQFGIIGLWYPRHSVQPSLF